MAFDTSIPLKELENEVFGKMLLKFYLMLYKSYGF